MHLSYPSPHTVHCNFTLGPFDFPSSFNVDCKEANSTFSTLQLRLFLRLLWGTSFESSSCWSGLISPTNRTSLDSEFSLENEVLKLFFLAGIFGCPTVRKFREFVAAVAGLLLFVVVCLSLSGVSFIYFLRRAWVYSCFVLCRVWATACTCARLLGERG